MKTVRFKLSPDLNLEMVEIPKGSFLMGSSDLEIEKRENEIPQHKVNLQSFCLGKFSVTQAQWFAVMKSLPEISNDFRGDKLPVVNVWLEKAIEFCAKLSILTGEKFRLPSEKKWEYACRAGTITPFSFGETITTDLAKKNFLNGLECKRLACHERRARKRLVFARDLHRQAFDTAIQRRLQARTLALQSPQLNHNFLKLNPIGRLFVIRNCNLGFSFEEIRAHF